MPMKKKAARVAGVRQPILGWKSHVEEDLEQIAEAWPKLREPIAAIERILKGKHVGDEIEVTKKLKDALESLQAAYRECPVINVPGSSCWRVTSRRAPRRRMAAKRR